MSIEQDLRAKQTAAMKAKDLRTANVIRMINTKVMERRTAKGFTGEVDDALILDVIGAYRKSLLKAQVEYRGLGERGRERVDELQFEIDLCSGYLPKSLGEPEVRDAVRAAIAELGAAGPKMTGRVVGAVMKQHTGRVDAPLVQKIAGEELAK
jgi:hypothetical protein